MTAGSLPRGLISRYAAPTDNGMLIFDVRERRRTSRSSPPASSAPAMEKVTGGDGEGFMPTVGDLYNGSTVDG